MVQHDSVTYSATRLILACLMAFAVVNPAIAGKPAWKGEGKGEDRKAHERYEHEDEQGDHGGGDHMGKGKKKGHFEDRDRAVINEYYDEGFRSGHCPPGLEKKHNGCMPPGQAKKWGFGRPLPPDVEYYELPASILDRLGTPPSGNHYVRVGRDILMISNGTNMVMDALQDLTR